MTPRRIWRVHSGLQISSRICPVSYVLGGHIELDNNGEMLPLGSHYHPHEHALQLTKQDLLGLPSIVSTFNGFYCKRGVFVLYSQSRILLALGFVLIVVLVACVMLVRRLVRRYLRRRKDASAH